MATEKEAIQPVVATAADEHPLQFQKTIAAPAIAADCASLAARRGVAWHDDSGSPSPAVVPAPHGRGWRAGAAAGGPDGRGWSTGVLGSTVLGWGRIQVARGREPTVPAGTYAPVGRLRENDKKLPHLCRMCRLATTFEFFDT
jgi:hypothetical protein